ncbi:hypothetical protein BDL97_10G084800 [Sphagnum fallax]|nr:hypothetical protein BDL97_10G084800 [Sphagnum fallax]KAH8950426.1 hypothetical protein BDL97_10G084800 [Sphagnum fallax]
MDDGLEEGLEIRQDSRDRIMEVQAMRIQELEGVIASLSAELENLRKENVNLATRLSQVVQTKAASEEHDVDELQKENASHTTLPLRKDEVFTCGCEEVVMEGQENVFSADNGVAHACARRTDATRKLRKAERRKKRNGTGRDMSDYATRHIALKLMYLGSRYHGFASQAESQRTVEAEVFAALERTRLVVGPIADAHYTRCGRTDKGVSAVSQVIALYVRSKQKKAQEQCAVTENKLLSHGHEISLSRSISDQDNEGDGVEALGSETDRVAIARASRCLEKLVAATYVPQGFSARFSCLHREYKYIFINDGLDIDAMKMACRAFEGEHDFSNFCKMDAVNVHNYERNIISFEILPLNEMWGGRQVWVMRVKGTAFLWHQVRCMAAVLFMVGYGHEAPAVVAEMLDVHKYVRKPQYLMAPELPLVLVSCGFQGVLFKSHPDIKIKRGGVLRNHNKNDTMLSNSGH